jgi:hypothetical protein
MNTIKKVCRSGQISFGKKFGQGGVSLNDLTEAFVIFLAFAIDEIASPKCNRGECGGG